MPTPFSRPVCGRLLLALILGPIAALPDCYCGAAGPPHPPEAAPREPQAPLSPTPETH